MQVKTSGKLYLRKDLDYYKLLSNPILDIAASIWEPKRYEAARICYRAMRVIDDLIDNKKIENNQFSKAEKVKYTSVVNSLMDSINADAVDNGLHKELLNTIKKFKIPLWPWERFTKSMIFDIHNVGFDTYKNFIYYSNGAAVAPAAIFVHFCGITEKNKQYRVPRFNVKKVAQPAALFCYLVHIIRDFQEDQLHNLNYFAVDILEEFGLTSQMLRDIAYGGSISSNFRRMMRKYYEYAENYKNKTKDIIKKVNKYLEPEYQASIEIIYNLYLQIFERIDIENGTFTTKELTPSKQEVKERIELTLMDYDFAL